MNQERITRTLEAAKTVSKILRESNVRCMVIGAAALAVHGYARIMLKLYAGDAQSLSDVHKLLEANPDLSKAKLEEIAHASGLDHAWHKFIS